MPETRIQELVRASVDPITQISVYTDQWSFYDISQFKFSRRDNLTEYVQLELQIGLLRRSATMPNQVVVIGKVGDYLFKDNNGNLTIIDQKKFKYV